MENVDRDMEKRVWQRVNEVREPNMPALHRENLKPRILDAQENAAAFRALALLLIGKQWDILRRLEGESMGMVHCLRGISALRGEAVKLTPLPQPRDPARRALEKCFRRCQKLWEDLDRRTGDPEYGMVFARLRTRSEEHCAAVAELIGKLE